MATTPDDGLLTRTVRMLETLAGSEQPTTLPLLARLAARLGLTARLHLRSGPDRVLTFVALAPTEPDVPAQTVIGERAALTRGCSGRVILAHLERAEVDEVLRLRPPAGEPSALRAELRRIRREGRAVSHAHNHVGRRGISVPLCSPEQPSPLGALSLSAPEDRVDDTGLRALLGPLRTTADELGGRLVTVLGTGATTRTHPLDLQGP